MIKNEFYYLDDSMKKLREEVLLNIYNNVKINHAIFNLTDLDIYSDDSSFFSRLSKSVRSSFLDNGVILTNEQEECLNILSKSNLFISAPTSFGKTFIALEYIARNVKKIDDAVFVVPTIALMNELRKKCYHYFGDTYTLITSDAELEQYYSESKKIIIVVPERISTRSFQKYLDEKNIDFLVYDEIYKLNSNKGDSIHNNERLIKMNYTYKYLIEKSNKILLLGPFIKNVEFNRSKIKIEKFITNLNLVYNKIIFDENFTDYYGRTTDKRFIYFDSPKNIVNFLEKNIPILPYVEFDKNIIEWISNSIHPDWYYIEYLKKGIGIHHGKTPIFLRKYIENEYSKGNIHTILCTSTLVEGINTPTNSLIVYDKPRGVFELNNLIGRVGRLNTKKPKIGNIYIRNREIYEMYDPDTWIDLNILYEDENIVTIDAEDESLYLEKEPSPESQEKITTLTNALHEKFKLNYSDVIDAGIEFKLLQRFVLEFDTITNYPKEFDVIKDIKYKLLSEDNKYLDGLKLSKYSFSSEITTAKNYLQLDPVYLLLVSTKGMKSVIDKFTDIYGNYSRKDINFFIDTLFQIDEFIKFKMTKMISIYELFDQKGLFDTTKNRAFIQSINMIKSYSNSIDGYERILTDLGFPKEDFLLISSNFDNYSQVKGTESKLKEFKKETKFQELSPFGKKIISEL
ncbi:hypothetical protein UAY_00192 [Enterococcus moraviensis ATCC BAA-383]|uniref:Helicase ATP-binding domain-containing protein n=1 Tax=Enterococcus moraviensis ATCC BAA-383 TaxID=1158609 RepID=R2RCU3_9ENTE|nr:DEAD/DEAH box helicase [Enterococcus moraviensis]EOI06850.1 hypothetical protein UAY_00192 [Enterococcus moraviensis ATCC BAA-383]EOT65193.1 hypothetical protein I586_02927 [Enterococcus moraviensis ATCC BAA-383]